MQFQAKPAESLAQLGKELFRFVTTLKSHHEIMGKAYDDHVAPRLLLSPLVNPQVDT